MATSNDIPCVSKSPAHHQPKRTEFITIRVSSTVKADLVAMAEQQNRTLSWVVNKFLEQFVSEHRTQLE